MKALSVKQPWANRIASQEKTIETRRWETSYRGSILIVSCKKPNISPAGCALAVAQLVDCRPMTKTDESAAQCEVYSGAFSWILADIRAIEPIPVKGAIGIFDVDICETDLRSLTDSQSDPTLFG